MRSDDPTTRLSSVAIVSPRIEKQAALLFDRLYVPTPPYDCFALDSGQTASFSSIPSDIAFRQREVDVLVVQAGFAYLNALRKITNSPPVRERVRVIASTKVKIHPSQFLFAGDLLPSAVAVACHHRGIPAVPLYTSQDTIQQAVPVGQKVAYQAAVNNISVISEQDVSWAQIRDFRQDRTALAKYRDLRLWFNSALAAKSLQEATDVIAKNIEDYEWALRKHGVKTVTGAISQLLTIKSVMPAAAGALTAAAVAGSTWAALTAGLVVCSEVAILVVEKMIDFEDIKRGEHSEIAILLEIKRKLGNRARPTN